MENKFISLLYPNEKSHAFHSVYTNLPSISEEVCDELGLTEIFNLKKIKRLDMSITGTIKVLLSDGTETYTSRRNVTKLKRCLGIKG